MRNFRDIVYLFILFLVFYGNLFSQPNGKNVKELKKAEVLYKKQKDDKALGILNDLIDRKKMLPEALTIRAEIKIKRMELSSAFDDLNSALSVDSFPKTLFVMGKLLEQSKKFEDAERYYLLAAEHNYNNSNEVYLRIANCSAELNKWQRSIDFLGKVNSTEVSFFYSKALALFHLGRFIEGLSEADKALKLDSSAQTLYIKAICLYEMKDTMISLQNINKAIKREQGSSKMYLFRAQLLDLLEDHSGAVADYSKAIMLQPDYYSYYCRGKMSFKHGDYHSSLSDFEKASELKSNDADILYYRGAALYNLRRYNEALVSVNASINIRHDFFDTWFLRALIKGQLKDYNGLIDDLDKAIELKPESGEAWFNRGLAKYNLMFKRSACLDWEQAKNLGYVEVEKYMRYCQ